MAGTGKKWALGCGIGCGIFLLIGALVVGGGIFAGKRIAGRADQMEASFEQVQAEYGDPSDYSPAADGRIPADRLETFLAVRADMAETRDKLATDFLILDGEQGGTIDKIKAGIRFVPGLFDFIEDRNRVLLEQGMGQGEYQYIYALAYYGVMHMDPGDGPGFAMSGDDDNPSDGGWRFESDMGSEDEEDVRENRAREVRKVVNTFQAQATRNQLETLETEFGDLEGLERDAWRAQLEAELESMESEHLKFLWEDGAPDHVSDSVQMFLTRLEESYDPMTSILEMGLINHD